MASSFINDIFPKNVVKHFSPGHAGAVPVKSIRLHLRNIYIMPTIAGMGLIGVAMLTLVAAINFQNSLIYMLCFWLGSLLVINILYTFRNLSGLKLELMGAEPCFAGQNSRINLRVTGDRCLESIYVGWKGIDLVLLNLQETSTADITVSYPAPTRGRLQSPRLDVFTRYPTGLVVAWAYATLDINAIVYPVALEMEQVSHLSLAGEPADDGPGIDGGVSDFSGLRAYQSGDSIRRVHWAKFARTGKLYSKVFVDYAGHEHWLLWEELLCGSIEQRLSHLCFKVLELEAKQQAFGLRIPGMTIEPGIGASHRDACLTALALFPGTP